MLEIEIRLLGPFQLVIGGRVVALPSGHRRALLAALALNAGRPVSVDALAWAVWDEALPANVRASLSTHVLRLRKALGDDAIETTPDGYRLAVPAEGCDVAGAYLSLGRFADAVSCASTGLETIVDVYDRALACGILAEAHEALGEQAAALRYSERCLAGHREVGSTDLLPQALVVHGRIVHATGRVDDARTAWLQAQALLGDRADPLAATARVLLADTAQI